VTGAAATWRPRRPPRPSDPVASFPAPFVPALSRALRRRGGTFLDAEPAWSRLPAAEAARFGYGAGSFRTGPVTAATARIWIEAAAGRTPRIGFAEREGRTVDLLRPGVEPGGFRSLAEAEALRRVTVAAVRRALGAAHTLLLPLPDTDANVVDDCAAALAALRSLGSAQLVLVPTGSADLRPLAAALARDGSVEATPPLGAEALAEAFAPGRSAADEDAHLDRFAPSPGGR
jgi:hypothetical protein